MEIKFGKFFRNPQKEDKKIKIMREMMSNIEDKKIQYAYIKNSREREGKRN